MVCEYPQHYVQAPPTDSNLGGKLILLGFAVLVVDCVIHTLELHANNDGVQAETRCAGLISRGGGRPRQFGTSRMSFFESVGPKRTKNGEAHRPKR